ncbi:hypothetical protein Tco_0185078 [Tanacetum coccineum]
MPLKSAPLTQAVIRRMIKESIDAVIAAERARHANAGKDARGSGPVRGQDVAPVFEKTESVFGISECAEGKKVKFAAATLQGPALTWWNTKVATMGLETVNDMYGYFKYHMKKAKMGQKRTRDGKSTHKLSVYQA